MADPISAQFGPSPVSVPVDHEMLQALLDNAFQGVMALRPVFGAQGSVVDLVWTVVNTGAERLLSRRRGTLIGGSFMPTVASWPVEDAIGRFLRVAETGDPDSFDLVVRLDGRPRVLAIRLSTFDDGVAVHHVLVELQRVHGLLAALIEHPARKTRVGRLLEPGRHGEVGVAGGHFVVDLLVEQLGEFGIKSHGV
jgi:PAS domain-containing protein